MEHNYSLQAGDIVRFSIGNNPNHYKVLTDPYHYLGGTVVDLEGYSGEVSVEYLKKVDN